jgi:2-polyprenyl-3-methyl-5-hydroxy-6-metoxy-1,4-benzoquinol methylase
MVKQNMFTRINNQKYEFGDKKEIILSYITGKEVLDLGCVDHNLEWAKQGKGTSWLHNIIKTGSKYCLGVDLEENEIEFLKKQGDNVVCANVEILDLPDKDFDVAIAGELIEHLDNPGMFLQSIKKHLKDDGRLILTTPSPWFIKTLINVVLKNKVIINSTHTCYFDPTTLSYLLERNGYIIEKIFWINTKPYRKSRWLMRLRQYLSPNFLVVAKKVV